jgi:uncharacterized RDD family membrane protein YckC
MTGFVNNRNDSSLGVQTPEGIEFILYTAGLPIRACAWAVDCLIQGTLLFIIIITIGIMREILGLWLSLVLAFVLDWFYHLAFEVFCHGQSPGKRIMGIRVVRGDGSPVNPGASFLRNLLRFADSFLFLYLIAFICMLVSPGFRRFGDWAADTLVVYTDPGRSPGRFTSPALRRSAIPWLADVPMAAPSRNLDYEEKQAILSFARRYPLLGKARADEIAKIWADKLRNAAGEGALNSAAGSEDSKTVSSDSAYILGIAHTLAGGSSSGPSGRQP